LWGGGVGVVCEDVGGVGEMMVGVWKGFEVAASKYLQRTVLKRTWRRKLLRVALQSGWKLPRVLQPKWKLSK
jgi:hypothetical protein